MVPENKTMNEDDIKYILQRVAHPSKWTDLQTNSYNYFLDHGLRTVFNDMREVVYLDRRTSSLLYGMSLSVRLTFPTISNPCGTSGSKTRISQVYAGMSTYNSELTCTVSIQLKMSESEEPLSWKVPGILVGHIPVMVGSKICNEPPSKSLQGFFVINGQDKVIVSQERIANNHPMLYCIPQATDTKQYFCEVRSTTCNSTRVPLIFTLRLTIKNGQPSGVTANIPFFKNDVPLGYIFCALGLNSVRKV